MPKANSNHQTIRHPLQPLYNQHSKILILGSFPSVKTREYGFFYGHPQNRFWPLLEELFQTDLSQDITERKQFLLDKQIAVYDTIYQCDIIGSSDASIKNVVPADLSVIFDAAPIQAVFCNGGTAYKYFQRYQAEDLGFEANKLPSTSPANARYRLDDLLEPWRVILEPLSK